MRCKKDMFQKGNCFHFYNKAVGSENLFNQREDYLLLLKKLELVIKDYSVSVFAYCLMPNHFHFFLRQDSEKPIYKIFNRIFSYYIQVFNHKYNRKGRLFNGPLQHKIITNEKYLVFLCQYIHLNPLGAGLVENIEDWEFSNYLEWIGKRNEALFNNELLRLYFENSKKYEESIKEFNKIKKEKEFNYLLFDNKT